MPREQIVPLSGAKIDNDPNATAPVHGEAWQAPGMHVAWMPPSDHSDGHVQVCLEVDPRYVAFVHAEAEEQDGHGAPSRLWSDVLSRTEINKLIRTLRTARDKAYGRDE